MLPVSVNKDEYIA